MVNVLSPSTGYLSTWSYCYDKLWPAWPCATYATNENLELSFFPTLGAFSPLAESPPSFLPAFLLYMSARPSVFDRDYLSYSTVTPLPFPNHLSVSAGEAYSLLHAFIHSFIHSTTTKIRHESLPKGLRLQGERRHELGINKELIRTAVQKWRGSVAGHFGDILKSMSSYAEQTYSGTYVLCAAESRIND